MNASIMAIMIPIVLLLVVLLGVTVVIKSFYRVAGPNKALVITGPKKSECYVGKGKLVIPFFQTVQTLSLENISIDFRSKDEIPTHDAINISVDAVANIAISNDPARLQIAASKFLGRNSDYIRETIIPVLEGNIREIISQLTLKQVIQGDKKELSQKVVDNVEENLNALGLDLITFNIQSFNDASGIINNLGMENIAQITKDAEIAKANATKEVEIAKAQAAKESSDARIAAELEIAKKQTDLSVQKAELQKQSDNKRAEAEAAYSIQEQEQRKVIEIKTADANLARQEKEIELKAREVEIMERKLEAEVKKTAEAKKFAAQQEADAQLYAVQKASDAELFERAKQAEAQQIEAEREAAAKKALAEAVKIEMESEAAGVRAKGEAEAAAIQAKATAEAEGLLKKAEAMKQYGEAAQMSMQLDALKLYFEQLPAIADAVGKGYTNVDKIVMLGGESSKLSGDIMNNVTQISEGLSESLGIDIKSLLLGVFGNKVFSQPEFTSDLAAQLTSDRKSVV